MSYVSGDTIKNLRELRKFTQRQLAEKLNVSDKAVSKWETGRGLPDISILSELSTALGVSIAELMTGNVEQNSNRSGNIQKSVFYVCPVCGNVICSVGRGVYSCCGVTLPCLDVDNENDEGIKVDIMSDEYYVSLVHDMTRSHYISFIAYVTCDSVQLKKLYPQQNAECYFSRRGSGMIYAYCNRHGLLAVKV